jgi:serine protease Do
MRYRGIELLIILLLAVAGYAQAPPSPQAPPKPPSAPAVSSEDVDVDREDADEAQAQAEEARQQAEEARKEAQAQAEEARKDAQAQAEDARKQAEEARKEAAKARTEANKVRQAARAQARAARVAAAAARGSYLGVVDPTDVRPEQAASLKLKEGRGVIIGMVDHDSPAGKAGLKEHDVILSLNGKPVENTEGLRQLIRETPPGKTVPVGISRDGQPMTMNVQLARRPEYARIETPKFPIPPMPPMPPMDLDIPSFAVLQFSARNGVMVEDLSPQLAEYFGVKDGPGVLVRSVDKGSAADSAGLKAGDVIVKAGGERVTCSADWRRAVREHQGTIPLGVVRDKREQSLNLKLPERKADASVGFDKDFEDMKIELQKMRPQIEREVRLAQVNVRREMAAAHQKEFERMRIELQKAGEEIRKSIVIEE